MKHVRILGLALAAVFAIAAYAASSAMALPEWGQCTAKAGGNYSDANCTIKAKKGTGSFEWTKGKSLKPDRFSGENIGSGGLLVTRFHGCDYAGTGQNIPNGRVTRANCVAKGGEVNPGIELEVECESEHNTGEAVGTNGIQNISVKFLGCKLFGSVPCSNGPVEGEIQVNPLKGELGYINKAEHKVGVLLEPVSKHGTFATFDCAGVITTVVGVGNSKEGANYLPESKGGWDGIISPITPVNQMTSQYEQVYTVNRETDENIPSNFEKKHIELLEDYAFTPSEPQISEMWSPAGEEITNVNTPVEEGEIKG